MTNRNLKSKITQIFFFLIFWSFQIEASAQLRVEVYDLDFKVVSDDTFSNKKGHWRIDKNKNSLVFGEENTSIDQVLVYEWPIISVEKNTDYITYAVKSNGNLLLVNFYTNKRQVSITYSDAYVFYTGEITYPK